MNLPGDLLEPEAWVEGLADRVLLERLDLRRLHATATEEVQSRLEQQATEASALVRWVDRKVGDPTHQGCGVQPGGDITDDAPAGGRVFGDEDAVRLQPAVLGDGLDLSALPAAVPERAEQPLHVLVDRHGPERLGRDLL